MSNRLWIAVLNEWKEKFSEILGIYTKPSYKDRPLRKTVFSISLGRSLYTGLTVLTVKYTGKPPVAVASVSDCSSTK